MTQVTAGKGWEEGSSVLRRIGNIPSGTHEMSHLRLKFWGSALEIYGGASLLITVPTHAETQALVRVSQSRLMFQVS